MLIGNGLHHRRMAAAHDREALVVDARFERPLDGLEKVVAVILDVKRQQVVAEQPVQDLFAPRADAKHLADSATECARTGRR